MDERRVMIGTRLRAERRLRRWDVPEMARRLIRAAGEGRCTLPAHEVLVGYVRRWEAGRAGVSERFRLLYAAALEMPEDGLFRVESAEPQSRLAPSGDLLLEGWTADSTAGLARLLAGSPTAGLDAQRIAYEWLISEPPQLYEARAGRKIGARLTGEVEARVEWLRTLDDYVGGEDLRDVVARELAATARLLGEASYSEREGRRLLAVFADLCQIGGWITSDAGDHAQAERYYLAGVRAAFAAGDKPTAANLLSTLSYQVANVADPRDAVRLARAARAGAAQQATPLMRALLAERLAWAYARLPDGAGAAQCELALGAAEEAFAQQSPGVLEPPAVYWLDRGEMDVMAGRCYTELARPLKAEPLLVSVLARYDDTHAREKALYESWLADTYLHAREPGQAAQAADRALDLSLRVHSARSKTRLQHIRHRLHPYAAASPAVRAFEDHYRATQAA